MATRVEANEQEAKLPDNFNQLSDRGKFLERRRLYKRLLKQDYENKRRPDLKAMKRMKEASVKFDMIGSIPGVEVGDSFDFRAEMFVVGLHRAIEAGVVYVHLRYGTIASSVVISGAYKDNIDRGEIIEYTGHGCLDKTRGSGKHSKDQKLIGGNLALRNSYILKTPVRVIRGLPKERKPSRKTPQEIRQRTSMYKKYSYDGLYIVSRHQYVKGTGVRTVYKFRLVRLPNQPALDPNGQLS